MNQCKRCGSPARLVFCSRKCMALSFSERVPPFERAMSERLEQRSIRKRNGCIEYTGQSWGTYGQLEYRRITYLAHRVAWRLANGPIPPRMCICHSCDNPKCINPKHLFLGSYSDNVRDMIRKGRAKWNPMRKLTDEQIADIRSSDASQRELAERFGISQGMVSMVRSGKRRAI